MNPQSPPPEALPGAGHEVSAPSPAMAMIIGQARDPAHVVAPIAKSSHGLGEDDLTALMRRIQETTPADAIVPAAPDVAGDAGSGESDALTRSCTD